MLYEEIEKKKREMGLLIENTGRAEHNNPRPMYVLNEVNLTYHGLSMKG